MNPRLLEIERRMTEIRGLLESGNDIDLEKLTAEARELSEERSKIMQREELAGIINANKAVTTPVLPQTIPQQREDVYESTEYRTAFMEYVVNGTPIPTEFRANQNTLTTDVLAIIPPTTLNKIQEKLTSYGMILPLVNRTAFKTGVAIPTSNMKPVATWVNEGAGSEKQKEKLGASIVFGAYKLRCAVSVSLNVEVTAWTAFEAMLVSHITEAMAKALEASILTGTGTGQPLGILTEAGKGHTVEAKTATYELLTKVEGELPLAYENGAKWVMTKKTFMAFVGMTDANGQPIARVDYGIGGVPERTLLGRQVVLTEYLKNISDTLTDGDVFAMLFNFADYTLNTAYEIGIKTYEDNETDDIVRKSIMLVDGKMVDDSSLVKVAYKSTAK